jgi:transposase
MMLLEFVHHTVYMILYGTDRIIALLPSPSSIHTNRKKTGRPRMNDRTAMNTIFYVLRTGCQWKALPRSLGVICTPYQLGSFRPVLRYTLEGTEYAR